MVRPSSSTARWAIVAAAAAFLIAGGDAQQQPQFVAKVDLVTIDVQVTAAKDAPLRELSTADFEISISGRKRPATSATHLHDDEGTVRRDAFPPPSERATTPTCVFGFHRKTDRKTAHYLVGVERTAADREEVKQVRVNLPDKDLAVQWIVFRTPLRRGSIERPDLQIPVRHRPAVLLQR